MVFTIVGCGPEHTKEKHELVQLADKAMYFAKENNLEIYVHS